MPKRLLVGLCGIVLLGLAGCGKGNRAEGSGLLFVHSTRDVSRIYLWRPGASAAVPIGPKGRWIDSVAWSPDGKEIAFGAQRGAWDQADDTYIYEMRPDGTGIRQLAPEAGDGPGWSPDGDRLLYYRATGGGRIPVVLSIPTGRVQILGIGDGPASWGRPGIAYVERGSRTIKLVDPAEGLSTTFAATNSSIDELAWGRGGRLAVLEGEGRWIAIYSPYGRLVTRFRVRGEKRACGIAAGADANELLVTLEGGSGAWLTSLRGTRWRRVPELDPRSAWCGTGWSWR